MTRASVLGFCDPQTPDSCQAPLRLILGRQRLFPKEYQEQGQEVLYTVENLDTPRATWSHVEAVCIRR